MRFRDDIGNQGPSNFIKKLKDGESISGIMRGDPVESWHIWEEKKKTEVAEGTPGARFSFKINMIVKEGSVYVPKIFDGGASIYKQLAILSKEWDLDETVIIISREGTDLNTEYTVMPAPPKQQPTKEALEHIRTIELLPLGNPVEAPKEVKNYAPGAAKPRY